MKHLARFVQVGMNDQETIWEKFLKLIYYIFKKLNSPVWSISLNWNIKHPGRENSCGLEMNIILQCQKCYVDIFHNNWTIFNKPDLKST